MSLDGFVLDLSDFVGCDYCGAEREEPCRTRSGVPTARTHSQRLVWVDSDDDANAKAAHEKNRAEPREAE